MLSALEIELNPRRSKPASGDGLSKVKASMRSSLPGSEGKKGNLSKDLPND